MAKRTENLDDVRFDRAVDALLSCKSILDAARKADIPNTTLRRMLGNPKFQVALREGRTQVLDAALTRLRGLAEDAVEVVAQTMAGKNENHLKYNAARWIIEHGIEGLKLDVDERIRALEGSAD